MKYHTDFHWDKKVYCSTNCKKQKLCECGESMWNNAKTCLSCRKRFNENNPNWREGRSSLQDKIRSSLKFKKWRQQVLMRDNQTCQTCSQIDTSFHSHHIIPVAKCLDLGWEEKIYDIDNGTTLCVPCHQKVHIGGI